MRRYEFFNSSFSSFSSFSSDSVPPSFSVTSRRLTFNGIRCKRWTESENTGKTSDIKTGLTDLVWVTCKKSSDDPLHSDFYEFPSVCIHLNLSIIRSYNRQVSQATKNEKTALYQTSNFSQHIHIDELTMCSNWARTVSNRMSFACPCRLSLLEKPIFLNGQTMSRRPHLS